MLYHRTAHDFAVASPIRLIDFANVINANVLTGKVFGHFDKAINVPDQYATISRTEQAPTTVWLIPILRQRRQTKLFEVLVVSLSCFNSVRFQRYQLGAYLLEVDYFLSLGRTDVTRDIEVVFVILDFFHRHAAGVAIFFLSVLVGRDDFLNVFRQQAVLAFALFVCGLSSPVLKVPASHSVLHRQKSYGS